MRKQLLSMVLVFMIFISMTSCAYMNYGCDPDKYRAVDYHYDETQDMYYLEYQGERYYHDDTHDMFAVSYESEDGFVDLGWYYNLPFTYCKEYYSYTTESPDYIFSSDPGGEIYFKESFDYKKEIFVVENTEVEIEFSEAFSNNTINVYEKNIEYQTLCWYSKKHNALSVKVQVLFLEEHWYMYIYNMDRNNAYQISDVFLDMLIENGIVAYE